MSYCYTVKSDGYLKGKFCHCFLALKNSVYLFLSEINELPTERECLLNDDWLNDLAFFCVRQVSFKLFKCETSGKKLSTNL